MDGEIVFAGRHAQRVKVERVVLIAAKHDLAIVAALQHMHRNIGGAEARQTSHGKNGAAKSIIVA
ncbi:hypothetical protein PSUB009319_31340 [Ralstonia sp. SET104]|nr:hypothetical protein PSUB009319_31340 [Ralstonia sp. SET104]